MFGERFKSGDQCFGGKKQHSKYRKYFGKTYFYLKSEPETLIVFLLGYCNFNITMIDDRTLTRYVGLDIR